MIWQGTFTYFNGVVAKPHEVQVTLYEDVLSIIDPHHPEAKEIFYPFRTCHYKIIHQQAYVYLNRGSTEYLILPLTHPVFQSLQAKLNEGHTGWFRRTYQRNTGWLVALFIIIGFSFLYLLFKGLPPLLVQLIPVKQEIQWGKQIFPNAIADSKIDSSGTILLKTFASDYAMSKDYPIELTLVDDTTANAFAVPGGNIVVYSGLIAALQQPEELYALLAHEATHVNKRHSLQQMLGSLTSAYLFSMIGSNYSGLGNTLIQQAGMLQTLQYSRQLEAEADWKGQEMMKENGIDPAGMTKLMESLQLAHPDHGIGLSFLSTHPITSDRIAQSKKFTQSNTVVNKAPKEACLTAWQQLKLRYP